MLCFCRFTSDETIVVSMKILKTKFVDIQKAWEITNSIISPEISF
jgi:hypothetical protein